MGRKHGEKRRKCWFPAFSPFPTMFSKGLFLRVVKSQHRVVKRNVESQAKSTGKANDLHL